jgi:hypothetical protein
MGVVGVVSAPEPGPIIAAVMIVLIVVVFGRLLTRSPSELIGETLHYHGFLGDRDIPLAGARELTLGPSAGGFGQLHLKPAQGRAVYPILMLRTWPIVSVCMPPDDLDRLGQALLATGHVQAEDLRTILHLQAEHLRAGGSLETSPLRGPKNEDGRTYLGDSTLTMLLRRAHEQS